MEKHIKQVKEFHEAFGHPVANTLKFIPVERAVFRHKLLQEEVSELLDACVKGDMVEVADGMADCLYILFGPALEYGIADKLPALFDEVHRSNMSKLDDDGHPIYRADGKVMKSNNYTPPNLKAIVWNTHK